MKTSKLILFSYIGLLAAAFLIFVIYLTSIDGDGRNNREDNYKTEKIEKIDLPHFEYIKVDNQQVHIYSAESNSAHVSYEKDSVAPEILWRVNADTLYILSSEEYKVLNLNLAKSVNLKMTATDAKIYLSGMSADTASFSGIRSHFTGFHQCSFDVMYADLSHTNMQAWGAEFNVIRLALKSSELSMNKSLKRIEGHATENSKLRIGGVQKIGLEMDESSVFRCYP